MLVPEELGDFVAQGLFVWRSDPIVMPNEGTTWRIVLNARLALGFPVGDVAIAPHFRLRNQVVVGIQAWFAGHAARPGCVSIG